MPAMDGTGPKGQGPMTGGGFGKCNADTDKIYYGCGTDRGMGRGRGNRRYARRNMVSVNEQDVYTEAKQQVDESQKEAIEELSRGLEELKAENEKLRKLLEEDKQL